MNATNTGARRRRVVTWILALPGIGLAFFAIATLFSSPGTMAAAILAVPAVLYLVAAWGWAEGRGWAPVAVALAAVATIGLGYLILMAIAYVSFLTQL